jgi:long-chain fatty acid transport protein
MKRTFLRTTALILSSALAGQTAQAANGTYLIGSTPASQAMGGTGVAQFTTDGNAIFRNPALLTLHPKSQPGSSAEASVTYLSLSSSAEQTGNGPKQNNAKIPLTPQVSAAHRVSENFGVGLGFFPVGGSFADYANDTSVSQVKAEFNVSRVMAAISVADPQSKVSAGIAPFMTLGKFQLNGRDNTGTVSRNDPRSGSALGILVGVAYQPKETLSFGMSYVSRSRIKYVQALDLEAFGPSLSDGKKDDFHIEQPEEFAMGGRYSPCDDLSLTADYRYIRWHDSDGTRDLGWSNQHVIGVGAQYSLQPMTLRAGLNYGTAVLMDDSKAGSTVNVQGHTILTASQSVFATAAFPALTTTHATLGAGYEFTPTFAADLAFVYAFKGEVTRPGTAGATAAYQGSASQWSAQGGARFLF